ncbi:MAG: SpoIIE family protein phosphatase [Bacteroidales bacterium]|nr:SpoIIE family protein phosphatase [Bacteroidales bacterium]
MYRILLTISLLFVSYFSVSQQSTGLLPIEKYNSDNLGAQPHCFAFAQDSRNAIYVGNKDGLLVYTGVWNKYITNNATEIRGLAVAFDGNIYIGNENGFGYYTPNDTGIFVYHPLDTLLSEIQQKEVTKTQIVISKDSSVYFVSGNYLYKYHNKHITTIHTENEISNMTVVNNQIIVVIKSKGLYKLLDEKLIPLLTDEKYFTEENSVRKFNIGSFQDFGDNKILFITNNKNKKELRILDLETHKSTLFNTQLDSVITKIKVQGFLVMQNSLIALRIENKGIYIIDNEGNFIRKIDKSTGLQSDIIESLFLDKNKILWAAHKTGISRIDIFSNYEYFSLEKLGIKNAIEDIKTYNDTVFFAVQNQLSYLETSSFDNNHKLCIDEINKLSNPKILPIEGNLSKGKSCYKLLNFNLDEYKSLLFITYNNIVEKKPDGSTRLIYNESAYTLFQDKKDPRRVWVALYPRGLSSMYYKDDEWIDEGLIENTSYQIYDINADKENNIWMGTYGLLKLNTPVFDNNKIINANVVEFDTTNGLSANDTYIIHRDNDKIFFASDNGLYEFNNETNSFTPSSHFGNWIKNHFTLRFHKDLYGKTWTVSYPKDKDKIFIKSFSPNSEGSYFMNTEFSKQIKARKFFAFHSFQGGLLAAGDFSVVKLKNITTIDTFSTVNIFINKIEKTNKKTIFGGTYTNSSGEIISSQSNNSIPILEYKDNNLVFAFSGISNKVSSNLEYRWWLEGNDEHWEQWNLKTEVRFTNLHEGDYTFWVQTRDIYGNESEKLSYSFTVNPPWNRTIWAFIVYFILFIAFVWGAIQYSTRKLKLIINEATAEIQKQKSDIETKSEEIVSSIRYAQRIQEAVIPNVSQMNKSFPHHFVLWKPRDIVSGDYYWMMEKNGKILLAAADCTGHGVPGAFMSIMGISFLNEIANNPLVQSASAALDMLRQNVITSLNQEGSTTDTKDGMDMSICVYDFNEMTMEYSGAYNPMYMIRNGELSIIKADRMPIGIHERDKNAFTNIKFNIHKGDIFYILSDGYIDQFGGEKGKKYMTKRFKKLILDIHEKPMADQREILWQNHIDWRGDIEQIDDIIVIGVKV